MPPRRYGVFTPCAVFLDPTKSRKTTRVRTPSSSGCPVAPNNLEPQGGVGSQGRASLRAASNASEAASEERDTRPAAKVFCQVFHKANLRRGCLNPQPLIGRPSANASARGRHAGSQWSGLWPVARGARFSLAQRERAAVRESASKSWSRQQTPRRPCGELFSLTLSPSPAERGRTAAEAP